MENRRSPVRSRKLTDACTVKLALCVSISCYSIVKEPKLLSTKCRNFNSQILESSSSGLNRQSQIGNSLVEVRGFEPLTPWLQTMCSANSATPPDKHSRSFDLKFG